MDVNKNQLLTSKINNSQIARLKQWVKDLQNYLSKELEENIDLFLINRIWLEKYYNYFIKKNKEDLNFILKTSKIKDISESFIYFEINEFPNLFGLNQETWEAISSNKEQFIKVEGGFYNKILIFKISYISPYIKNNIYSFFYLDKKENIRQGYIKINENKKEEEIIEALKKYGPLKFIDLYINNDSDKNWYKFNYFEMVLQDYKNEKKKIYNNFGKNSTIFNPITSKDEEIKKITKKLTKKNQEIGQFFRQNNAKTIIIKKKNHLKLENIIKIKDSPIKIANEIVTENNYKKINFIKVQSNINPKRIIIVPKNRRSPSADYKKRKKNKEKFLKNFGNLKLNPFFPIKAVHKKSTPGIIGLDNIGATCYMNATLQCFSNIQSLKENLLNKDMYKNLEENKYTNKKLSFALAEVLKNLWENLTQNTYSPENFKKVISEMNPLFEGVSANDPKDLVIYILETIHKELNNPPINNNLINNNRVQTNYYDVYQKFMYGFNNNNKSIISDEFYGFTNSITTCNYCKISFYNVQTFNILFFPLEEIRKFKGYNFNTVNIYDCFDYNERNEIYNSIYCENCRQNYQALQQTIFIKTPKNLIINLNRGKGLEYNVNIVFEEYLNLKRYVMDNNSPFYYELVGIICHHGPNDMGGHFIAYCKNYKNCGWYKYNDSQVTKCTFNEIRTGGLPYVLFYSYIES